MLRRSFLRALPITAAAVAIPAVASAPAPVSATDRLAAAIAELKAAAEAVYPQVNRWSVIRSEDEDHSVPLVLMAMSSSKAQPPRFVGPGIYEFHILDDDGNCAGSPVAFLDHAPKGRAVGEWFRWQHYHQGRFQGRGHYIPASRIRIIRKVEALGEQA